MGKRLHFERLLVDKATVGALFVRLRAGALGALSPWTFYPDCHWLPTGTKFRSKPVDRDTVAIWASIGEEVFYLWLNEDTTYQAFLIDDDKPGVEPAMFDEILVRLSEILAPATGFITREGTMPDEPTFAARYAAWDAATKAAGTR